MKAKGKGNRVVVNRRQAAEGEGEGEGESGGATQIPGDGGTHACSATKSSEHVVLYAWPGGRSHGFVASAIAQRLAKDHEKVSLLVATMDYNVLAPRAGPDVNVVAFPTFVPRTFEMMGMEHNPGEDVSWPQSLELVKRLSAMDDPVASLTPIAMIATENSKVGCHSCLRCTTFSGLS